MRIINIEDCLELMCGLLIEEEFTPAIEIAEKDKKLLLSIAQSTFRAKALSDRQYAVVKKILTNGYQKDFLDRNIDLPSSINNIRRPLRKIDRSEYIAIENYQDNLSGAGYQAFSDTGKCLVVRFPFNMKYSKLITEIKKFILFPSEGYKSDNYKHIFPYNETIVYKTIDLFKGHIKDIQSELLDIYNQIDGYRNAPEKHIPGIYGLQIKNTPEFIAQSVVDKIGDPTLENLFLYHDKRDQIGLVHFDKEDLTSSTQNLKPLTKKILSRNHSFIQINKKQHPINEVLETLLELQRFPLLVILDDKEPLDQLVQFHNLTKNIIPIEKISVMFRKENRKEGRHFNDYVKSQNLNNKLDINTKIVYINNKKIPKDLLKEVWEPECVISLGSVRHYNKIDKLIHQYDLTIHYDKEDGYWNDMIYSIEKI
jgi:hypothetical protein|tara:strand:- start:18770 stop:20044 length:1275 start_codon:yes stop_codon:yes gene_type:complete